MRRSVVLVVSVVMVVACSAPPQKELDLAQGALNAARAAGAEQYAPEAYNAAAAALQQGHDAVAQRDYRLALTRALDAHDRAQEAAKGAADGKARARSEAEIAVVAVSTAVQQLQARIKAAEAARLPRRDIASAQTTARAVDDALQKARAQVMAGDYLPVKGAMDPLRERIEAETAALDAAIAKKPARGTGRSR